MGQYPKYKKIRGLLLFSFFFHFFFHLFFFFLSFKAGIKMTLKQSKLKVAYLSVYGFVCVCVCGMPGVLYVLCLSLNVARFLMSVCLDLVLQRKQSPFFSLHPLEELTPS